MATGAILPLWLVMPVAALAMIVVAAHIEITSTVTTPSSRRRIRLANGWVMLVTIPLLAAGVSYVVPETQPRAFALVWATTIGFVFVSLLLASLDLLNTFRLANHARRGLRNTLSNLTREIRIVAQDNLASAEKTSDDPAAS